MVGIRALERWKMLGLAGVLALLTLLQSTVHAQTNSVRLGWKPSPSPEVTGYTLYYGLSTGQYTSRLEAGNATNVVVNGLSNNVVYYFTIVAHDDTGLDSPPSNEVIYQVPSAGEAPVITLQPVTQSVSAGGSVTFTVGVTGTAPLAYQWRLNGSSIVGATTSSYTKSNVQAADAGDYSVVVTNSAGAVTSSSAALTVIQPPAITTQPLAQSIIQGSNVTFTVAASGTAPLVYQWRFNGTPISGATASSYTRANVQPIDEGAYSVVVTNLGGSITSSSASLVVVQPPVITSQPIAQSIVQGSNVTFTVTASGSTPLAYQWRFNGSPISGATGSSFTKANVQPADAGQYSVAVTNLAGSVASSSATLTVIQPPAITTQPLAQSIIQGSNVTFAVAASGTAPLVYQWRFNGAPISGATANSYTRANVQPVDEGSYSVLVTNLAGAIVSSSAILAVIQPPAITTQPQAQSIVLGSNVTFTVTASGSAPLAYQWRLNGFPIAGATASAYTKANVQIADGGQYSVQVTNVAGAIISSGAALTVIQPPTITAQPVAQSIVQGSNVTFTVTASGTGPLAYQWCLNGTPIAGATAGSYTKSNVQAVDAGSYSVVVTNLAGSIVSSSATLTVLHPPSITTQPVAQSVIQGSNVTFTVTASGATPLAYQWRLNGSPIAGATTSSYTRANVQPADEGGYSVVVTNLAGTVVSSSAALTVLQPPVITSQPLAQSIVQGSNVTFTVTASGSAPLAYQWRFNGTPIAGATTSSYAKANVQTVDAGLYSVLITNLGGSVVSSGAALTVIQPPSITAQPVTQSIIQGSNVTFTVAASGTAPLVYQWRFNGAPISGATASSYTRANVQPMDEGAYSVLITNLAGSITSSSASLVVVQPPVITSQPIAQSIVQGSNVTFTVTASGSTPLAYQWRFNGSPISGATGNSFTKANVQPADAGQYSVAVTNLAGSVVSSSAALTVIQPPAITTQPLAQSIIQGSNVTFTVAASGTAPLVYQWRFNGAPISGATASSYTRANVQPMDEGAYSVLITNLAGSITSSTASLAVVQPPVITSQPIAQSIVQGSNVTFTVTVSGSTPLAYQWRFNGAPISGATASSFSKSNVQIVDAGNYSVLVTNSAGAVTSASASLTVIQPPIITTQPVTQSIVQGSNATFTVAASGTAPLGYQWSFNGSSIPGANGSSYTRLNVQPADEGDYSALVTNLAGAVTSSSAALMVIQPPVISTQPVAQSVVQGSSVTFAVTVAGSAPLAYQWRFNGSPITGANANSYTRPDVQIADAGQYSVTITNLAGSVTSADATLTVIQPAAIVTQPVAQSIVQGSNVTFTVNASGTAPLTYQWRFNGASIFGANAASYTRSNVQIADAGQYSVVVTNLGGSVISSDAALTVIQPPAISSQPLAQTIVQGSNVTFILTASGTAPLAYEWRFNGSAIAGATASSYTRLNVQPADEGAYSVRVTNLAGSIVSSSASLTVLVPPTINTQPVSQSIAQGSNVTFSVTATGSAPLAYQWRFNGSPIAGATANSYTRPNVQLTDEGVYSVMVTNLAGSIISSGANLTLVQPPVIITQPLAQSVVLGSNAVFSVVATGSTPLAYQWFRDGSPINGATNDTYTRGKVGLEAEGEYSVRVSNAAGFTLSSGAWLTVLQPPYIAAEPLARTVVQGSTTTFSVTAFGSGPLIYQWRFNGSPISEATASSYTKSDVQPADAGEYSVLVTNMAGSVTSSVATLTVVQPPTIVTQPVTQSVVQGSNATFTVTASGTEPVAFQWSFNGSPIAGANGSSYTRPNVQLADAGQYSVAVTNLAGSATSSAATLTVIQPPVIITQPLAQSVIQGSSATFTVSASGTQPLVYQWNLNGVPVAGASASSYTKLNVQPADAGQYSVTVSNPAGSVTSSGVTLKVIEPPLILIQPLTQAAALGSRVSFAVSASGTGPLAYAWRFNGLPMPEATNSSFIIESVGQENEGSYVVEVKNSAGSVVSLAAVLTVTEVPVVNVGPADVTVPLGSNACFRVIASGTAPLAYQWLFNGTVIVGATATNLVINNVQAEDVGLYSVQITNSAGSTVSPAASLSLIYAPTITSPPQPRTALVGASAVLMVEASGVALTYQWFWDDSPIEGATNAAYTIAEASFADAGNYRVEVSNPAGMVSSPTALLTVIDRTITGRVSYYSSYPPVEPGPGIGEVTVSARNESTLQIQSTSTTAAGAYELGNFDTGYGITVTPVAKTEAGKLTAISALDVALIDRHTRGTFRLDGPYKLLAADVDMSGEIDGLDVQYLRSILLSGTSQLPKGTWRFVPADYRFAEPTTPWNAPTSQGYADLISTPGMVNFVGVKLGDVDGSWAANSPQDGGGVAAPVILRPSGLQGTNGELVTASISVEAFTNVTSLQFTLAWDPSVLEFVGTGGYTLRGVDRDSFGPAAEVPGELRFVWHDPDLTGVTLLDGTRLFTVTFRIRGVAGEISSLELLDSELARQVSAEFRETAFLMPGSSVTVQAASELRVTNVSFTPGSFQLSTTSELGVRYYVEYTTLGVGEGWKLLGSFDGDGTVKTFEDPGATNSARFYRIRTELTSP